MRNISNSSNHKKSSFIKRVYFNETLAPLLKQKPKIKVSYTPSEQTKWELIKQSKQLRISLLHKQNQMTILQNEENTLMKKIKKLKKKRLIQSSSKEFPIKRSSFFDLRTDQHFHKHIKSNSNLNTQPDSKFSRSLYEQQKKSKISQFRRSQQIIKSLIYDNRLKDLQSKIKHVSEHQQQRQHAKQQVQLIKSLKMMKLKKKRQNDLLKEQEANLQYMKKQTLLEDKYKQKQQKIRNLRNISDLLQNGCDIYRKNNQKVS